MGKIIYTPGPAVKIKGGDLGKVTNFIEESISGGAVEIDDGIDMPVKDLSFAIKPKQDLFGYGYPWAAGCGEQMIPYPYAAEGTVVINGITFTIAEEGRIGIKGTATADADLDLCGDTYETMLKLEAGKTYAYRISSNKGTIVIAIYTAEGVLYSEETSTGNSTFTLPNDGLDYRCRVILRVPDETVQSNIVYLALKLQKGSASTDFTPYENVCPISGRTGATIRRTGKNLIPNDTRLVTEGTTLGAYKIYNTFLPDGIHLYISYSDNDVSADPGSTYGIGYVSEEVLRTGSNQVRNKDFRWTVANSVPLGANCRADNVSADNAHRPASFMVFPVQEAPTENFFARYKIMICLGDAGADYEPYQKTDYLVSWEDEAGTIYGGTLDVTTGIMTIDTGLFEFDGSDDENWANYSAYNGFSIDENISEMKSGYHHASICNWMKVNEYTYTGKPGYWLGVNNNRLYTYNTVQLAGAQDVSKWRAYLAEHPLQLTYPLAEPLTFQIRPVTVSLLNGTTVLVADCGEISVTYNADTKKYIDQQVAELQALILEH